jgi:hypothetical protein
VSDGVGDGVGLGVGVWVSHGGKDTLFSLVASVTILMLLALGRTFSVERGPKYTGLLNGGVIS